MRDQLRAGREQPRPTPFGFLLAGDASMQSGRFEPVETALLQRCIAQADVFVDIGANVGFYTCLARRQGRHAVAIEPLWDNLRYLYRNLTANGWDDVEVWPLGLAPEPGLKTLYGAQTGASLVAGWAGVSPAFNRTIAVTRLDLILGDRFHGKRMAIKIDVEGAEYGVLQGAGRVLERSPKPVWLIEIVRDLHHPGGNRDFARTFDLFRSRGYLAYKADAACTPVLDDEICRWAAGTATPDVNSWIFAAGDFHPEG